MTEQEIQAANLQLDFDGVEEAQGSNMTMPGTIGMFTISDCVYAPSKDKGTPGLKFTFDSADGSSFTHTFWLTGKALSRLQHLAKHALNTSLSGKIQTSQLVVSFKGKKVALKVTAQINESNGRVYPDLPFGGFAADKVEDLKFNGRELEEIEKGKALAARTNNSQADAEDDGIAATADTPGTQGEADDF